MAIAAMILWMFTAGAGVYLLRSVIAARGETGNGAGTLGAMPVAANAPLAAAVAEAAAVPEAAPGIAAVAGTRSDAVSTPGPGESARLPPPTPHVRVTAGPDDHPLLEFAHPALGIAGLACWAAFVISGYPAFAWIASAVLVVIIAAGLAWLRTNARAARRRPGTADLSRAGSSAGDGERPVPLHLIVVHGLVATATLALTVVTMLTVLATTHA